MHKEKSKNQYQSIIEPWKHLGRRRRVQFFMLFALMMVSVFAEIVSIGAIVPFLSALTNPDSLMQMAWFRPIVELLHIETKKDLLFYLTVGFISAAFFAGVVKIVLLWANTKLSASMGIELKKEVYAKTLYQSYEYHVAHNSSQLISLVTEKVGRAIFAGILHVLMLSSALVTSIAIITTLILLNPIVALIAFTVLGGGYILAGFLARKKIQENGRIIAQNQPQAVKCMQEGLGGIRDIILEHNQKIFIDTYAQTATTMELAGMRNSFLGNLPKTLIEILSITLIATLAYYLQVIEGEQQVLPLLGALALGAQKLLPALQQVYFSWSTINGALPVIDEVVEQLSKESPKDIEESRAIKPLPFTKEIKVNNLSFRYQGTDNGVLKAINLTIKKGQKAGFIGKTGSGKSTLLDIIMGLLKPIGGHIEIDGVKIDETNITQWQKNIAHVPQSIFLTDATIAENIAFGIPKEQIDTEKVKEAAKKASLDRFVEELPEKYDTFVGERGVQLSGGQRQRIGIARALYKEAPVIVFDEATSALDDATEKSVMEAINNLSEDLTILMIAHRLSTLEGCDIIYKLDKGKIVEKGSYKMIIENQKNEVGNV